MAGSRTVECYVTEIIKNLNDLELDALSEAYDTLQRMKNSKKSKHELNYWKVLQCLGEMAADRFVVCLPRSIQTSCKCHLYSNMLSVLQLFMESLSSVALIKRIIVNKVRIVPFLFKSIQQNEEPSLLRSGLTCLYRLLIVGKGEIVEFYMKARILKEIYEQIKSRQGFFGAFSVLTVQYCAKLLLGLTEVGDMKTRNVLRRSLAKQALIDYTVKMRKENTHVENELSFYFSRIKMLLEDENLAQIAVQKWNCKEKLKEDLEQGNEEYVFCSSPLCRKQYMTGDHFQYCGACRLSRYCSQSCQKKHWKLGHKEKCLKEPKVLLEKCLLCTKAKCK